jgi:hypothetical protein
MKRRILNVLVLAAMLGIMYVPAMSVEVSSNNERDTFHYFRCENSAVSERGLDFNEDTTKYLPAVDATPTGIMYRIDIDWGGSWSDAEKTRSNSDDDLLCWAATGSNVLEWSGWGKVNGMTNTDQMFSHFQDHWTDQMGNIENAWIWWFYGINPMDGWVGWSQIDVPGGGNFWLSYNLDDYYHEPKGGVQTLASIDEYLHNGYGIGLSVHGGGAHAITCWGFNYDLSDPDLYVGIWVTDSDDGQGTPDIDRLRYYKLQKSTDRWYIENFYGTNKWFIGSIYCLGAGPGIAPKVDAGLDIDTTEGNVTTFNGSFINPGAFESHSIVWDFGDGSANATGTLTPTHAYQDNGEYTVTLQIIDEHGDVGVDTCNVLVKNVAPTVSIYNIIQPNSGYISPNDLLQFFGSFTDPGTLDTHTIMWDFGDGTTFNGNLTPTHAYVLPGIYNITLTVTDDEGGIGIAIIEITVEDSKDIGDLIRELIESVYDMNLHKGLENALVSKLKNALKSFEKGNYRAAVNQISAFLRHVNAQRGKKIPENGANELIDSSMEIINLISNEFGIRMNSRIFRRFQ